jgi:tetratricopeptide (TPR) repeat protein
MAMSLLKLFSGPSPEKLEQKGDALFEGGLWGRAKLEYERALHKLEKETEQEDDRQRKLATKILKTREALAQGHRQTAKDLIDGGYFDDARDMLVLAMEVAADGPFRQEIEQDLKALEAHQKQKPDAASPDPFYGLAADDDEEEPPPASSEDGNFFALLSTLPDDVQDAYLEYGEDFKIGYIALNNGDFQRAATSLSRAMEENPEPESYIPLELAAACLNLDRSDEAQNLLENFLEHHPEALPAYQLLCEIYWEQKNFHQADILLESIPHEFAESLAIVLLKGETIFQAGNFEVAGNYYQSVLDTYGWDDTVARELAKACEAQGEPDRARDIYKEIMNQCSSCHSRIDPVVKHKYAELCFAAGMTDTDILEMYLSLAREIPGNAAHYFDRISRIYTDQGNASEAERFRAFSAQAQAEQDE